MNLAVQLCAFIRIQTLRIKGMALNQSPPRASPTEYEIAFNEGPLRG
jgi:hypothetical protein